MFILNSNVYKILIELSFGSVYLEFGAQNIMQLELFIYSEPGATHGHFMNSYRRILQVLEINKFLLVLTIDRICFCTINLKAKDSF